MTNSFSDLTKLKFKFLDLEILDIQSKEFQEYIYSLNPKFEESNFNFFQKIIEDSYNISSNKRYAVFKRNYGENYDERNLYLVYELLLIIFPSELIIEHTVTFQDENSFVQRSSMSSREIYHSYTYKFLHFHDDSLQLVNEFIELVFERLKNTSYIGLAIENYMNSYTASHIHFQYITYCMALENIVTGPQELTYRLKRAIAILCGNDLDESRLIFKNIDVIYKLRSKIVHGEKFDVEKLQPLLLYLNSIVSILIIELLIHNIANVLDLNERITQIGFGERDKISENWKPYILNPLVYYEVRFKELQNL